MILLLHCAAYTHGKHFPTSTELSVRGSMRCMSTSLESGAAARHFTGTEYRGAYEVLLLFFSILDDALFFPPITKYLPAEGGFSILLRIRLILDQ